MSSSSAAEEAAGQIVNTPAYAGEAGGNLWRSQANPAWENLYEHFDIKCDTDKITNPEALKSALDAASLNFNSTTAAALDAAGEAELHELFYGLCQLRCCY